MDMNKKIEALGIVPVVVLNDADDAVPLCKALAEGGLPVAEITFRTAAAEESIRLSLIHIWSGTRPRAGPRAG